MTRTTQNALIITSLSALLVGVTGCNMLAGPDDTKDWWYYCDATGCYRCNASGCEFPGGGPGDPFFCYVDKDCPTGTSCDQSSGYCINNPTGCKTTSQCAKGYVCLDSICKPGRTPCESNAGCGAGAYCSNGTCKNSGLCTKDKDCASAGGATLCDARGSCIPGAPGPKTCSSSATCGEGLCVDGSCGACSGDCGGASTCQFAVHCGDGRACLDGQCVNTCQTKADCGSAQLCVNKVCRLPSGSCVKDSECGTDQICANGTCYAECTSSGACSNAADRCSGVITAGTRKVKICTPDNAAKPECALTKDCGGGEQCVNGICRTTCVKTEDCANCDDGPICGLGGFCMTAEESKPECSLNKQCAGTKVCVNNKCK